MFNNTGDFSLHGLIVTSARCLNTFVMLVVNISKPYGSQSNPTNQPNNYEYNSSDPSLFQFDHKE